MINAFIALYHVPSQSGRIANAQSYWRRVENIPENRKSMYEGPKVLKEHNMFKEVPAIQ